MIVLMIVLMAITLLIRANFRFAAVMFAFLTVGFTSFRVMLLMVVSKSCGTKTQT